MGAAPSEIRFRAATRADDPFFFQMEFLSTWESLEPEDRARLKPADVKASLRATHELLLDRPGTRVVIAEDGAGEGLGLLWFGINRNLVTGEDEAWVYSVAVRAEHQGRGVGRLLMEYAENLAREYGFTILGLMVASHNLRARGLYEKLGFRDTNVLMRKRL